MKQINDIDFPRWGAYLAEAQLGNEAAFEKFLEEAYPFVRTKVAKRVGALADADDITQECLIGVYRSLASYDPNRALKPWLLSILRFKVYDYFRKVGANREEKLSDHIGNVTEPDAGTNLLERKESLRQAQAALEELPDKLKRAMILTKVDGLTYAEASLREGITEAALRKRISRAYQILGEVFQQNEE